MFLFFHHLSPHVFAVVLVILSAGLDNGVFSSFPPNAPNAFFHLRSAAAYGASTSPSAEVLDRGEDDESKNRLDSVVVPGEGMGDGWAEWNGVGGREVRGRMGSADEDDGKDEDGV